MNAITSKSEFDRASATLCARNEIPHQHLPQPPIREALEGAGSISGRLGTICDRYAASDAAEVLANLPKFLRNL